MRLVVEMTSLEGVMGREYALLEGQPAAVADAIFEHYLPRSAGDQLPQSAAGALLALADRLDSLIGLFAVNLIPTASADPFALRRSALGLVQILLEHQIDLNLREAINLVAPFQPVPVSDEAKQQVLTFIAGRLEGLLRDEFKMPYDAVTAVLKEQAHNPYRALIGVRALLEWIARPDWSSILDSFARCARITRNAPAYSLHAEALTPAESQALYTALQKAQAQLSGKTGNVGEFLAAFAPMVPVITTFFEKVLVMDENQAVSENRLALLQAIVNLSRGYADLSQLSGF
jgi:glycyl-tRNA synthetase